MSTSFMVVVLLALLLLASLPAWPRSTWGAYPSVAAGLLLIILLALVVLGRV